MVFAINNLKKTRNLGRQSLDFLHTKLEGLSDNIICYVNSLF